MRLVAAKINRPTVGNTAKTGRMNGGTRAGTAKLSWVNTARAMAECKEDWSWLESGSVDGLNPGELARSDAR